MLKHCLLLLCVAFTISSCETLSNLPGAANLPVTETEAAQGIREALESVATLDLQTALTVRGIPV